MATKENKYPEFYGECDRDEQGKIRSFAPAWENARQLEEEKETVDQMRRNLDLVQRGVAKFDPGYIFYAKKMIEKGEERVAKIENSKPQLTDQQTDACQRAYKEIKNELRERLPTASEMDGYGSSPDLPFKEVAALTEKTISGIDPELARATGIEMENGKVNRKDLSKIFQRLGNTLGERSDEESARRKKTTIRTQSNW